MLLKPALGGVGGGGGWGWTGAYAAYSVTYEENQSSRVSDCRDLCVLCFQRQSVLTFILPRLLKLMPRGLQWLRPRGSLLLHKLI